MDRVTEIISSVDCIYTIALNNANERLSQYTTSSRRSNFTVYVLLIYIGVLDYWTLFFHLQQNVVHCGVSEPQVISL